jgi:hypothetical protein
MSFDARTVEAKLTASFSFQGAIAGVITLSSRTQVDQSYTILKKGPPARGGETFLRRGTSNAPYCTTGLLAIRVVLFAMSFV